MAADRVSGSPFSTRSTVMGANGMVATSHPLATQIGLDVLRKGGSAVDAAIASNAAIGLMEPTNNGIGGDLFAIVWDSKSGKLHGLNASGRSPRSLSFEWFQQNGFRSIPHLGPLSVSVPGAVDGWFELHRKFGHLPIADCLQPAIDYARNGHPVHEVVQHAWADAIGTLSGYPGFSEQMTIDGRAPGLGELWRNPNLARTLEMIAQGGRDAFYCGDMAQTIASSVQANGGFLSKEDLSSHRSEWVNPKSVNYRGWDVWELPPNGQGIAALQMLQLMKLHDVSAMGFGSTDYVHLLIEAKKLVYEDRARFYTDPDFSRIPVDELISENYALQRAKLLNMGIAAAQYPHGEPDVLRNGDTIYLTTADARGNMVSLIQSNYHGMGSGMTPPGLGFVLQNRGVLFSLDPAHANCFAPVKRPFHTIIPAFVTRNKQPLLSFGVMGGGMQPQGHVQIVTNLVDFGMGLQEAGDAPRVRHQGSSEPTGERMSDGGYINLESGFDPGLIPELRRRGHNIQYAPGVFGGYQAIMKHPESGVYFGASESRKDGQAAGF